MTSIEMSGRSVDEAVKSALNELGMTEEEVTIEVIEEPSRGFLGILGAKDAKVRVVAKKDKAQIASEFLSGLLDRMNISGMVETRVQKDIRRMEISGEDLGLLIGRHGQTLRHLEFLTNVVSSRGIGI